MRLREGMDGWIRGVDGWRRPVALSAGVAVALALPLPGWAGLAWLGPGVLFFSAWGARPKAGFRLGYAAGLLQFLVSLNWMRLMPSPAGAYAAWIALSAYLALFWGVWTLGVAYASAEGPPANVSWFAALQAWGRKSWGGRTSLMLAAAVWWVGLEFLRGWLFSGFPWNFLGATQWRNAPLLQTASVAGVYGVSFLVCWCSLALVSGFLLMVVQPANRLGWLAEARVPLLTLLVVAAAGFHRVVHFGEEPRGAVRLALVQPSLPQELIWDRSQTEARFRKITDLSRQALATQPDALIWPEASMDFSDEEAVRAMRDLTARASTPWVFGADDYEPASEPGGRGRSYNAAWATDAEGRVGHPYHKQRLVIFGEYVPLADHLPFLRWLTPIGDGFTPGDGPAWFTLKGSAAEGGQAGVSAAPVICFEDTFPATTRAHVRPDTDFLLELTNDGWFQRSSAQWQHAANAALRAVENGVPLVRCANNGLTCWFDGCGRLRDLLGDSGPAVYEPGFLLLNLPLAAAGHARPLTFYHAYGDWFAHGCAVGGLGWMLLLVWRVRRPPGS